MMFNFMFRILFQQLLYQENNQGINYEYAVPVAARTPAPDSYLWTTGEFEECSQTCGGGIQNKISCNIACYLLKV